MSITAAEQQAAGHPPWLVGAALRAQPDGRLVTLVREGNERAFEEIVRRYRASLLAYASAITPAHRADDVIQDSLSKAFAAIRKDEADIDLRPWLYRIVRNSALNDLRSHRHPHEQLDENYDGVEQPPEALERRQEIAALVLSLKALPDAQREAIVQRELAGMGHSEIAKTLNVSPGAVRQLIFRARRSLREGFGQLLPLPLVRVMISAGQADLASSGTDAAGAGVGIGLALKGGAALLAVGATVVAGTAVNRQLTHHHPASIDPPGATAAATEGQQSLASANAQNTSGGAGKGGSTASGGGGSGSGTSGSGGSVGSRGGGSSGKGGAGDGGSSQGGSGGSGDRGHSGSGDGGSGGSGDDGGSGDSGSSGSGDSGSSGSGDSGSSGSGDSGSSGSGDGSGDIGTTSDSSGDGGGDGLPGGDSLPGLDN